MKKIDISTKKFPQTFALVDDCDYQELNCFKWYAQKRGRKLYAKRNIRVNGKQKGIRMHCVIMGHMNGKEIDHRTGNTLDNQRNNLRHCTHAENTRNTGIRKNNTSGYKGVYWNKKVRKWQAYIQHNGKKVHLGVFLCLIKAAKAYDKAAVKYYGEFAGLNFPN